MQVLPPLPENLSTYYRSYVRYMKEVDLLQALQNASDEIEFFLRSVPPEKENFIYAPGKWMLKEVIGHLCDTERILTYRALRFARNDKAPLQGFEENDYVANSNFKSRTLQSMGIEFLIIRESSIAFFNSLDETDFDRTGEANKSLVSVRDLLFFIITHQRHHFAIIKERYLSH
ncbi:MAG: DinB family protein [Bacteroidetes bacterium]|jgi:uncharacterized damage-inducible protein DinB|nr:DinB family protein [Bacteroidota bacterium]